MWPLDLAPDSIGSGLVKVPSRDRNAIAHCGPAFLDMVKIARDRIDMDVTRNQTIICYDTSW
jgi:hypothetical protein